MTDTKLTQDVELLPCPFCGRAVTMRLNDQADYRDHWEWFIECMNCGAEMRHSFASDTASLWNTRALARSGLARQEPVWVTDAIIAARLLEANGLLRSAHSIAERKGKDTNWDAFEKRAHAELRVELPIINALNKVDVPGHEAVLVIASNGETYGLSMDQARRALAAALSSSPLPDARVKGLLDAARDWINHAPHDDRCFENDPNPDACRCVCGKDALVAELEAAPVPSPIGGVSEGAVERLYEHVRALGFHGPDAKPYGERSEEHKAKWRTALAAALTHPAPDARREALEEIAAERKRQVELEGWTAEHDDEHVTGQMASAAACYASPEDFGTKEIPRTWSDASRYMDAEAEPIGRVTVPSAWPWDGEWWKPGDTRRNLIKAGALIVAEIERLDRVLTSEPAK